MTSEPVNLFSESARLLRLAEPALKCSGVAELARQVDAGPLLLDSSVPIPSVDQPGRPAKPELVAAGQVARRRLGSRVGRIALIHAIAHIEFNAINLALDAVCRFRDMPDAYYRDWLAVAADEARHFTMLSDRLQDLDSEYGDLPAHDGLWEMAVETADECLVRMALVPRVLEARGLDVTPGMIDRLQGVGDKATVQILRVILEEEIGHVAVGTRWFNYCCQRQGLEPEATFADLLASRFSGRIRGPFNFDARRQAGFTDTEMALLSAGA